MRPPYWSMSCNQVEYNSQKFVARWCNLMQVTFGYDRNPEVCMAPTGGNKVGMQTDIHTRPLEGQWRYDENSLSWETTSPSVIDLVQTPSLSTGIMYRRPPHISFIFTFISSWASSVSLYCLSQIPRTRAQLTERRCYPRSLDSSE